MDREAQISRRTFLTGSAAITAVSAGVLGGCSRVPKPAATVATGLPRYWTPPAAVSPSQLRADVCVYGATSAGVMAAVAAARLGRRTILLAFEAHVGGLTTSGLGATDVGAASTIGGLAHAFYAQVGGAYGSRVTYSFEPHIASEVFAGFLQTEGLVLRTFAHLRSVDTHDHRIARIHLDDETSVDAGVFIDASYEGDLMAASGLVTWTAGREPATAYDESLGGVRPVKAGTGFRVPLDPYRIAGKPASGLLPGIADGVANVGTGDALLPAYNFRLCITDRPRNRLSIDRPPHYEPEAYELLRRYIDSGVWDAMAFRVPIGNGKYDLNSTSGVSTDDVGANARWVEATYAERNAIYQAHVSYIQGLLWFLAHDPRLPGHVRSESRSWGLARDEFAATEGWPPLLYVREARRMRSDYVITEADCLGTRRASDPIALASYKIDTHVSQRTAVDGTVANEGLVSAAIPRPFAVPYRSIVPARDQCTNLVVPVCLSASHVAFSSIRLEPVYMMLGQAAGTIAASALDSGVAVQDLDHHRLQAALIAGGQVL